MKVKSTVAPVFAGGFSVFVPFFKYSCLFGGYSQGTDARFSRNIDQNQLVRTVATSKKRLGIKNIKFKIDC